MFKINLGDRVKDKVTGLTGTVVCRTEWLYGCVRLGVQPNAMKDGRPVDPVYIDEPQLDVVTSNGPTVPPQDGGAREGEYEAMSRP